MTGRFAEPGYRYSPGWRRFTKIVLPPVIRWLMKRDWHGHQHIPREGGVIIAANHLSYADWPAVALFTYQSGRYPVFLIKSPMFKVKVIGALLRKVGQLPVHRGQADAALVLKEAERCLAHGACVVIYPEETATRDPKLWPMVAKTGVARLALGTGAPVIPVAHWGAQDILPYGTKDLHLFPRHTVQMVAGPPVDLSEFRDKPLDGTTLRAATAAVMRDITQLLAGLRGEQPPAVPYDRRRDRRDPAGADGPPHADPAGQAAEHGRTDGTGTGSSGTAGQG